MRRNSLELQFMQYVNKVLFRLKDKHFNTFAASIAFFYFLSLVPMLMVLCTILPYTPISRDFLISSMQSVLPAAFANLIQTQIMDIYIRASTILPIAAIILLWTACKGMMALMEGLNEVYDAKETRNYLIIRLIASLYTLVLLIIIVIGLLLVIVGRDMLNLILSNYPRLGTIIEMIMALRYVFALIIMTFLFSGIYTLIPCKKCRYILQLPGSFATALAWIVYSIVFSLMLSNTKAFSIYGSLSVIITLMIWLYFCMYFVLIGAQINVYVEKINNLIAQKKQ